MMSAAFAVFKAAVVLMAAAGASIGVVMMWRDLKGQD